MHNNYIIKLYKYNVRSFFIYFFIINNLFFIFIFSQIYSFHPVIKQELLGCVGIKIKWEKGKSEKMREYFIKKLEKQSTFFTLYSLRIGVTDN